MLLKIHKDRDTLNEKRSRASLSAAGNKIGVGGMSFHLKTWSFSRPNLLWSQILETLERDLVSGTQSLRDSREGRWRMLEDADDCKLSI
jgi:hypothetical protein